MGIYNLQMLAGMMVESELNDIQPINSSVTRHKSTMQLFIQLINRQTNKNRSLRIVAADVELVQ